MSFLNISESRLNEASFNTGLSKKEKQSETTSDTSLPEKETSSKTRQFDPKDIIILERWQDYVFFGAMFITTCTIAKRIFSGNLSGTVMSTWTLATIVMGKIYTDDACAKYALGMIAKSMEAHVNVLEQEVTTFSKQLEESQQQLSRLGLENETFYHNNADYREAIQEMRDVMNEYRQSAAEHKATLKQLKKEIALESNHKEQLQRNLEQLQKKLKETESTLQELERKALEAQGNLVRITELIRNNVEETINSPSSFGYPSPIPFGKVATPIYGY